MKTNFIFLTSLLCLCAGAAGASECTGPDCAIGAMSNATVGQPTVLGGDMGPVTTVPAAPLVPGPAAKTVQIRSGATPAPYVWQGPVPMKEVKMLSIKPVPDDKRPPVWDGTAGKYEPRGYDKTVDWRDGVPIWDDSVVSYNKKDYTDWFLQPMDEIYVRAADEPAYVADIEYTAGVSHAPNIGAAAAPCNGAGTSVDVMDLYRQNMEDAATTRARVEELLAPRAPQTNLWLDSLVTQTGAGTDAAQAPTNCADETNYTPTGAPTTVNLTFERTDGCPFESVTECEIWRRKPMIRETVAPRSRQIRPENMADFIAAAKCNRHITADAPEAAPLLSRYKMLMRAANACCTDGMAYALRQAGASDGLVYKFMADDANFYGLGARCLMMSDKDLDTQYPNTATAAVAADVRNGCLCRGRQWFGAMLAPFVDVYKQAPAFANAQFNYTYTDGLQREVTVSINNDVKNVLNQLAACP